MRHVILNAVKNLLANRYETLRCAQGDILGGVPKRCGWYGKARYKALRACYGMFGAVSWR
jgi:hypothetical protein